MSDSRERIDCIATLSPNHARELNNCRRTPSITACRSSVSVRAVDSRWAHASSTGLPCSQVMVVVNAESRRRELRRTLGHPCCSPSTSTASAFSSALARSAVPQGSCHARAAQLLAGAPRRRLDRGSPSASSPPAPRRVRVRMLVGGLGRSALSNTSIACSIICRPLSSSSTTSTMDRVSIPTRLSAGIPRDVSGSPRSFVAPHAAASSSDTGDRWINGITLGTDVYVKMAAEGMTNREIAERCSSARRP